MMFLEKVLSVLRQGFSIHFSHEMMCTQHMVWLFACFSVDLPKGPDDWVSSNVTYVKGKD